MKPFSQTGTNITRSAMSRWIWNSTSSRFLRSISTSWRWKRLSISGIVPYELTPLPVAYGSMRVDALPAAPVAPTKTFLSFLSRQADRKAARSMIRTRALIPTALKLFAIASPIPLYGGYGVKSPASKPGREPAAAEAGREAGAGEARFAFLLVGGGGGVGEGDLLRRGQEAAGGRREAERLGRFDGRAANGGAARPPYPDVRPG